MGLAVEPVLGKDNEFLVTVDDAGNVLTPQVDSELTVEGKTYVIKAIEPIEAPFHNTMWHVTVE